MATHLGVMWKAVPCVKDFGGRDILVFMILAFEEREVIEAIRGQG